MRLENYRRSICTACSAFTVAIVSPSLASAQNIDLADIVGGGNGFGTGILDYGANPLDGTVGESPNGVHFVGNEGYFTVDLPFIDGVFVPNSLTPPNGLSQLTSNPAHQFGFDTGNGSYDWIENGPNDPNGIENFSVIEGIDCSTGAMIGHHANSGITFDLDAIRTQYSGVDITAFRAVTGIALGVGGDADLRVFVDGSLAAELLDMPFDIALDVNVPIAESVRFLTIVATDGPTNSYLADRVILCNPVLEIGPAQVPAMSNGVRGLFTMLLVATGFVRARSRSSCSTANR